MLPLAIIEYGLISVSVFASIVAVNIWALFSGEPRLGIPFRIFNIKYDILIPYSLKNVTLVIVNYMKTMLMFSVCLAITSLLDLMDSSDSISKLAERLAHELINMEHCKMLYGKSQFVQFNNCYYILCLYGSGIYYNLYSFSHS